MSYSRIYQKLGFSRLEKLSGSGLMFDEIIGMQIPFSDGMGFPPAMIPFANSIGSFSYFGSYIYDIDRVGLTFVDLMVDEGELYEVGLNEEQFCYYLARRAMVDFYEENDGVDTQILEFCSLLGIDNAFALRYMSDEEFLNLGVFESGAPTYLKFGKPGTSIGDTGFQRSSGRKGVVLNHKAVFDAAIDSGKYQKAWSVLNSPGWSLSDAKSKFKILVDAKRSDFLTGIYDEWINSNHPVQGY